MFGKFTKSWTQIFGKIAEYSIKFPNIRQLTNIPFITETRIFGPKPVSVTHCKFHDQTIFCEYPGCPASKTEEDDFVIVRRQRLGLCAMEFSSEKPPTIKGLGCISLDYRVSHNHSMQRGFVMFCFGSSLALHGQQLAAVAVGVGRIVTF